MSFTLVPVRGRFLREGTPCRGEVEFEPSQPLRDTATGDIVSGVRTVALDSDGYLDSPTGVALEALDDGTTLPAPDPTTGLPTAWWRTRLKIQGDILREYVLYLYATDAGSGVQLATRLDGVATRPLYPYVLLPVYLAHVAETIADGAHGGLAGLAGLGIPSQATLLKDWARAEAFTPTTLTYDTTYPRVVASAPVIWPDGSAGEYVTGWINPIWQSADNWSISHTDSGLTVIQATITRNDDGDITDIPPLAVV